MARTAAPSATFENAQLGMRACRSVQSPAEGHASCVRDCHRSLLRRVSSSSLCHGLSSLVLLSSGPKGNDPARCGRAQARPARDIPFRRVALLLRSGGPGGAWCVSLSLHILRLRLFFFLCLGMAQLNHQKGQPARRPNTNEARHAGRGT